jgi:phosphatidylglycerol---prolipoprotein diacylglyceryl transferase
MYPILFTIPGIGLPIYSYGVMLGLSLVVGWYMVMYLGKKDGLPPDKLAACYVWTAVAALLGSRVLYIITNMNEYQGAGIVDMFNVRKGGLVAYGGFLGGFVGSWLYLRRQRIHLLPWADIVVPTLCTGLGITRLGCLMFGCDYGKPISADAPRLLKAIGLRFPNWEVAFPEISARFGPESGASTALFKGAPAYLHHVHDGLVQLGDATSALVFPTQLLASLNGWVALVLVMLVRKHSRFRGQAFLFFTAYYGATRALMEFIRGDTQRGGLGVYSTSQIVGGLTLVSSVVFWIILSRRAARNPKAAMTLGPGAEVRPPKGTEKVPRVVKRRRKK